MMIRIAGVCMALLCGPATAEVATYGRVDLTGLARESWPLNNFAIHNAMVCNVNGPDGFLAVRAGPGTQFDQLRAFNRLAVFEVDVTQRQGHWVRVVGAYRDRTADGATQTPKTFAITGWAHDDYLCNFLD